MHFSNMGLLEKSDKGWTLETYSIVSSAGLRNRKSRIIINIPAELLMEVDGEKTLFFGKSELPYGRKFTNRIAQAVFQRDWDRHSYGLMPGEYYYLDDGLHFDAHLKPNEQGSSSILFYSDMTMQCYVGSRNPVKMTISFQFGDANLYGLILPLDEVVGIGDLFHNEGVVSMRQNMERSIEAFIA